MGITLARIRGLSPLGPIFGKELRSTARRKRTYALRFLYLGALLLILSFFFAVASYEYRGGGVARKAQQLAEMGAIFFGIFSFFTLTAMGLVGPVLTATAINSERLHKTLPVLLMTPITAWQIVAGKLFSRVWIALTLIGLTLPALAVVRLLGGVETEQIVASLSLCVATVLFTASIGLLLSTLMNRAYAVILLSYGAMGVLYALVPFIAALILFEVIRSGGRADEQLFMNAMSLLHPGFAMAMTVIPDAGMAFRTFDWYWCALVHVGMAAVLLVLCGLILRRMARKENEGSGTAPSQFIPVASVAMPMSEGAADVQVPAQPQAIAYASPQTRSSRAAAVRTVSDNPVLWREVRRPLVAKRWQAFALTVFILAVLVLIYGLLAAGNDLDDSETQCGFAIIFCGLLTLLVCIISSTAIAQEKESDTWTLLLATPMRSGRIVQAKLAGLLRRLLWPSLLIVGHFAAFTVFGVMNGAMLWVVLWMIFTTNAVWLATGLYWSLRLKTVTFAIILNLLGPMVAYGGVAMVLGIAGVVIDRDDDWAEGVGVYAPYAYMVMGIEYLDDDRYNQRYNFNQGYNYYSSQYIHSDRQVWVPVFHMISEAEFIVLVFVVGMGHLLLAAGIVWWTAHRFDRMVGRAAQSERLPP